MRIVFMGSAELACPCLDKLLASEDYVVAGVVTQPDRPRGRSLKIMPCPVRALLGGTAIPVLTPGSVNDEESVKAIRDLSPDLAVVVAYGQILKPRILEIPRLGCINVHASLLPKYRGAAPIEWAIARGETMTGVTTIFMDAGMDTGNIICRATEPIRAEDNAGSLRERLARIGADLLIRSLKMVRLGKERGIAQVHSEATYAPSLKKSDGRIDWTMPATELHDRIRGFNPRPGCFFERSSGKKVRVFKSIVEPAGDQPNARAGHILDAAGAGPLVLTGNGALRLLEVQPEGRRIMSGSSYLCGYSMKAGEQLK